MTPTPDRFAVVERVTHYGSTVWAVQRLDGRHQYIMPTYVNREHADFHAYIANRVDDRVWIAREYYRRSSRRPGCAYWKISCNIPGDPRTLRHTWDEDGDTSKIYQNDPRAMLIRIAQNFIADSPERIAKATAEKEEAERRAIEHATRLEETKARGPLATDRQVVYALDLGATTEQTAYLTRDEASALITRLKANRAAGRTRLYAAPGVCMGCGCPSTMIASLGSTCDECYDDFAG